MTEAERTIGPPSNKSICPLGITKVYLIPFIPFLVLSEDKVLKKVFDSNIHVNKLEIIKTALSMVTGTNSAIIIAEREEWKGKRRVLAKTMHQKLLDGYGMNINRLVEGWVGNLHDGHEFIFFNQQYQLSLDILLENIFGCKTKTDTMGKGSKQEILKCFEKALPLVETRLSIPILSNEIFWKLYCYWKGINVKEIVGKLKKTVLNLVEERVNIRKDEKEIGTKIGTTDNPPLIIDILLNLYEQKQLTFDELISEAIVFFVAGIDTTSHSMSGIVYCLSHQDCKSSQGKLIQGGSG